MIATVRNTATSTIADPVEWAVDLARLAARVILHVEADADDDVRDVAASG